MALALNFIEKELLIHLKQEVQLYEEVIECLERLEGWILFTIPAVRPVLLSLTDCLRVTS